MIAHSHNVAGLQQLFVSILPGEGIIDKGLCGQFRKLIIAVGKEACKAQLAFRGFLSVFIQNMYPNVADGTADRRILVGLIDFECERRRGGLRLTVTDYDLIFIAVSIRHAFTARYNHLQAVAFWLKDLEHLRTYEGPVDPVLINEIRQEDRVAHCLKGHQIGRAAFAQRHKYSLHRCDKSERRTHRNVCAGRRFYQINIAVHRVGNARVGVKYALGLSRGTGGIDQQRRIGRIGDHGFTQRYFPLNPAQESAVDHCLCAAVAANKSQTLLRIVRR